MKSFRIIVTALLAAASACAGGDEAAIIATLTGARNVTATREGYQLVTHAGQWMRAVKTPDGGYSIFSTNGSARLFSTPLGFGYRGSGDDNRSITRNPRGFTVTGGTNAASVTMIQAGSAWLMQDAPNNERIIINREGGWSSVNGPLAPIPADTAYELFLRRDAPNQAPGFVQPAPDRATTPLPVPPLPVAPRPNLNR